MYPFYVSTEFDFERSGEKIIKIPRGYEPATMDARWRAKESMIGRDLMGNIIISIMIKEVKGEETGGKCDWKLIITPEKPEKGIRVAEWHTAKEDITIFAVKME